MKLGRSRHNSGQNLVELALLLPALILLIVVTIDLGRGVYYFSVIYNAAREGARFGIISQQPFNTAPVNPTEIAQHVEDMAVGINQNNILVNSSIITDTLKVEVEYCFTLITPIANQFAKAKCPDFSAHGIWLKTSSSMEIER